MNGDTPCPQYENTVRVLGENVPASFSAVSSPDPEGLAKYLNISKGLGIVGYPRVYRN